MTSDPRKITKIHYKMYKSGKIWLVAGIATTVLLLQPSVGRADESGQQADQVAVQTGSATLAGQSTLRTGTDQTVAATATTASQGDLSENVSDGTSAGQPQTRATTATSQSQKTPASESQAAAATTTGATQQTATMQNQSAPTLTEQTVDPTDHATATPSTTSPVPVTGQPSSAARFGAASVTQPAQSTTPAATVSQSATNSENPTSANSGTVAQPQTAASQVAIPAVRAADEPVTTAATQSIGQIENDPLLKDWLARYYGWSGSVSDYIQANPLGVASLFHVFSLDATLNAHTEGNVATAELSGNANFNTRLGDLLTYDYSYIQDFNANAKGLQSAFAVNPSRQNMLFVGKNVTVIPGSQVGLRSTNGPVINVDHLKTTDISKDTNGQVYIDFDAAFAQLQALSTKLAQQGIVTISNRDFADNNRRIIDMKEYADQVNDDHQIVINLAPDVMTQSTQLILKNFDYYLTDPNLADVSFVFNVDAGTVNNYTVATQVILWLGDTENTRTDFQSSTNFFDNHLLWNFRHTDMNRGASPYTVRTTAKLYGSLLAVDGNVILNVNASADGNLIGRQVIVNAQTHRWDFQIPKEPGDPGTPVNPGGPEKPVDPVDPGGPEKPVDPVDPGGPEKPVDPVDPGGPEKPDDPGRPVTPIDPGTPENPGTPETPVTPVTPLTPTTPDNPPTPEQPVTPVDPPAPEEPMTPAPQPELPVTPPEDTGFTISTGQGPKTETIPQSQQVTQPQTKQIVQPQTQPVKKAQTKLPQPKLPQTSETQSHVFTALGVLLLSLLTGIGVWLKRKFD